MCWPWFPAKPQWLPLDRDCSFLLFTRNVQRGYLLHTPRTTAPRAALDRTACSFFVPYNIALQLAHRADLRTLSMLLSAVQASTGSEGDQNLHSI